MAKRKKKSSSGGFGKPRHEKRGSAPEPEIIDRTSRAEPTLKLFERILSRKNFPSDEEMHEFFQNEMLGKSPEELFEIAEELAPASDADKAEHLLDNLPEDCSQEDVIQAAHEAIRISPDCIAAWLMLSLNEPDDAKALGYAEQGIERGTAIFQTEIEAIDNESGLWAHIPARDLLRLLASKAKLCEQTPDGFNQAEAAYRQCLEWCPCDKIRIRGDLLRMMIVQRRLDDAQAVLDAFPNDRQTDMIWGRALVTICQTIDRTGYEPPQENPSQHYKTPREYLKSLDPEFDQAKKLVRLAARANPFVCLFITEGGLLEVETPGMVIANGPYEAIEYLQKWAVIWQIAGLPMVMLTDAAPAKIESRVTSQVMANEIFDIADQIEGYDGPGWWTILDESVADEENPS